MNVEISWIDSFQIACANDTCDGYITLSVEQVKTILDADEEHDEWYYECPKCPWHIRPKTAEAVRLEDADQLVIRVAG